MTEAGTTKTTNDDFISTTRTTGATHVKQDTGTDERYEVSGADFRDIANMNMKRTYDLYQTLDTDAILASRGQASAENNMRLRHAEEEHHQKMRHENDLHTIRVQTLSVSSVGNSKIVENIATDAADQIVAFARTKLSK